LKFKLKRTDTLCYSNFTSPNSSHNERLVIGGVAPVKGPVKLPAHQELPSAKRQPYLVRREMGMFNVPQNVGTVTVDGEKVSLEPKEALSADG